MKFQVEDRGTILSINPTVPHCIISISDTREDRADPAVNDLTRDVLFLNFHDTNEPKPGMDLFTVRHAIDVLNFYERYKGEVGLFVAHCNAGMCRSPAVIAALQKIHTGNDDNWFRTKTPNSLVYRTILGEAYERGLLTV